MAIRSQPRISRAVFQPSTILQSIQMPAEVAAAESGGHRGNLRNLRNLHNLWPPLQRISPENQLSSTCSVLVCILTSINIVSQSGNMLSTNKLALPPPLLPLAPTQQLLLILCGLIMLFLEEVTKEVAEVHSDPPVQFLTTPGHFLIIPLLSSPYSQLTQPRLFLEEVAEEVTEVHSDPPGQFMTTPGHFPPHNLLCKMHQYDSRDGSYSKYSAPAARVQRRKQRASYPIWVRRRLTNRSRYLRFRNPLSEQALLPL
ncbi:hypothetical protein B0H13DRAFT_2278339 [Mycena leptocephala]|nr:hypothetical protein B0H13DRAFT_2278339 [Mycena leptocephala]